MAQAILDKEICKSCGADVRDGTQYCYACGKSVIAESEAEKLVRGVSDSLPLEESSDNKGKKLATAASERKRSRGGQRKPKQIVWEEPGTGSNRIYILVCVLIFIIAGAVVFLTVFMK